METGTILQGLGVLFLGITALVEIYYRIIRPRQEKQEQESQNRTKSLRSLKKSLERLKEDIELDLKNFFKFEFIPPDQKVRELTKVKDELEELRKKLEVYHEKSDNCDNWAKASKKAIKLHVLEWLEDYLPKTREVFKTGSPRSLKDILVEFLTNTIFREEDITKNLFESEDPDNYNRLRICHADREDLNKIFKYLNSAVKADNTIKVYINEYKKLTDFVKELQKDIDSKIKRIQEEIRDFSG